MLFSDSSLRGENQRVKQGSAFTKEGYSSWKKQYEGVLKHERSNAHCNAVLAQALFLHHQTIVDSLSDQAKADASRNKLEVARNRSVMQRIVDVVMFLGRQGLSLRGHRETICDDSINSGNFIEVLKLISHYDTTVNRHLTDVNERQSKTSSDKEHKGRGSKLTFLSKTTQNKLVSIISQNITNAVVKAIEHSRAWALIVDTTPDIAHNEQI